MPALLLVPTLFLFSCAGEIPEPLSDNQNEGLNISAGISKEIYTRDTNEGEVTSGTYYISYPEASNNSYTVAEVNFGTETANPQIGKVATSDNSPFTWSLIGGSTPTFYLDNVPAANPPGDDPLTVVFNDDNKFKAGVYDTINFSNDLLWGTVAVQKGTTGTLHFDLHHNMSRVRVMVTADNTYEVNGSLDLDGALVEISNINLNPVSYNRQDGSLTLDFDSDSYGTITLVNETETASANETVNWSSSWKNEDGYKTYISHSWVIPPQLLQEDNNRPRLTITLKNGSKFSGILPHAMEIDPPASSGTTNPYPVTLSFLKEHILTIRTVISETPPQLAFMPVKVIGWVDKGTFDLVAHQAGIYTLEEFNKLIEYYNANNTYQLQRYGPLMTNEDTGAQYWNFNFFSSILIQVDSIYDLYGMMKPGTNGAADYQFSFNIYPIFIRVGSDDPVQVSPQQLYNIMAGISTSPFS